MSQVSLELIRINKIHEELRLSYRDSSLAKALYMARKNRLPGESVAAAQVKARMQFLAGEESARLNPPPVLDGPGHDTRRRGW